jgi:glucose/arabinose dehydrogenase
MSRLSLLAYPCLLIFFLSCESRSPKSLPKPNADNGGLFLPDGFGALVVADSIGPARHLAVAGNGDIYVKLKVITADPGSVALRDSDNDGKADIIQPFAGYPNDGSFATEMRIHNGYLYFSTELVVYRQKLTPGELIPTAQPEVILTDDHPIRWHNAKTLAFDKEGGMYVTFSAPTNNCEDWNTAPDYQTTKSSAGVKGYYPCPQLTDLGGIWRFDANAHNQHQSDGKRFATGLRSIVAMSWSDDDNSLYAFNHGRDYLAPHDPQHFTPWQNAVLPAEEFMNIKQGEDYGWPYNYYDGAQQKRVVAPEYNGDGKIEATGFANPIMALPAHWAPNDMLFYKGDQFPERYKKGVFVAFHGSTNRASYPQAGYIVAFIPFDNGRPNEKWEVFADGFAGVDVIADMKDAHYRPMGLAEGPDGSLYVSDSKKGKIWRIIFNGDAKSFGDAQMASMEERKSRSYIRIPGEQADLLEQPK